MPGERLGNPKHPEGLTETQEKLALALFEAEVIQFDFEKGWRLRSHEKNSEAPSSPVYIDLRRLQSILPAKQIVIAALTEQAEGLDYDCLAGIPLAAVVLVSSMADRIDRPQITPRMEEKTHGQIRKIDGEFQEGDKVLLIDDLVTGADTKLDAIQVLEKNGLVVKDVVVIFDREQGGTEQLAEKGYALHAALKIKPTLKFYARVGKISQEQLNYVLKYLENPLGKSFGS